MNVYRQTIDQIIGQNGNREFTNLVTVLGCNVGPKFDLSKLNYNKIIIASDGDIDGYFIRSLLLAFFYKLLPAIIEDGRLFIAEPPLYRVDDKKNPFVINKRDYINRYVTAASKHYKLGYQLGTDDSLDVKYLNKDEWADFLDKTSRYVDDIDAMVEHYKINDRLLEIILEEFVITDSDLDNVEKAVSDIDINHLMARINEEYPEIFYDENDNLIKGVIDAKYQMIEITESMIKKARPLINLMKLYMPGEDGKLILKDIKTGTEYRLSLLGVLKILKSFMPSIRHRYKGLGENSPEDLALTILNPNTRTLIRVTINDVENDMNVFQILRGGNPADLQARRQWIRDFVVDREIIDT